MEFLFVSHKDPPCDVRLLSALAVALWTLGCGAELFNKLHFFDCLEVRAVNMSL